MLNCLNPQVINKSKGYRNIQNHSYQTLVVPCRECENCRRNRSLDFTIRAYYDYLYFNSDKGNNHKGFVMFDTLTFDEQHVKTYNLYGLKFKCFSAEDIKNYKANLLKNSYNRLLELRNLKKNCENRNICRNEVRKYLKQIIVSEYGSETHRPHYHILLFCKIPEFTPKELESLYLKSWVDSKGKLIGGVENIPAEQKVVSSIGKIIYVSGYVNKDEDFYTAQLVKKLKNEDQKIKNKFIPRTYTYTGFGSHIFDYYTEEELRKPDCKIKLPNGNKGFSYESVPMYILDKLFRDTVSATIVEKGVTKKIYLKKLNDYGVIYYKGIFQQRHKKYESDINLLIKQAENYSYIDNSQLTLKDDKTYSWANYFKKQFDKIGTNAFELATYALLYKGRYGAYPKAVNTYEPKMKQIKLKQIGKNGEIYYVDEWTLEPEPAEARSKKTMNLKDYRRRLNSVFTTKYYDKQEDITAIYETEVYEDTKLDKIISELEEFNIFLLKEKNLSFESLRSAKHRRRTYLASHKSLKTK